MQVLLSLVFAVVACHAATFKSDATRCLYPNWKCDCNLVYRCDGTVEFPETYGEDELDVAGLVKDLASDDYPLAIPGKRWRRNSQNQEEFCEKECIDRMNAFLCLDDGAMTDYSYSALCVNLLNRGASSPFNVDGSPEPCCTIYLEYGRQWCSPKWNKEVGTLRCLSMPVDASFGTVASDASVHNVFSVEGDCDATAEPELTWCNAAPTCPAGGAS